ncbi:MAG: hypothetical protein LBH38_00510 [Holosporales bacterium]|jgi:inorganic pyrophosphatase|nr:hypothetical protein [Holosporales bacterium]
MRENIAFWATLDHLLTEHRLIIDRPKGTAHPRFPTLIYPLDYGYLEGTTSADGQGIDVFVGTASHKEVIGILCTFDKVKKDSEIKILYACTEKEVAIARSMVSHDPMRSIFVRR